MKAVVLESPGHVRLVDRPLPQPAPGEVRLRVEAAGMCHTDAHIFHGHFPVPTPRVLGHELAGTVDAVGPGVDPAWIGQAVAVQPARFCGVCASCLAGHPEACLNFQCLGNTHDGGYAEYTVARVDQIIPLKGLSLNDAVWLEPLACVIQALGRVPELRSPVLISGAGTFGGLFTQVLSRVHGQAVAVVDPNPERVDRAKRMGASAGWVVARRGPMPDVDAAVARWSSGGPALLVDTTGKGESIARLLRWAGPRATVILFGVSSTDERLEIAPSLLFQKQLTILASAGMTEATFAAAVDMLRSGVLSLDELVVGTIPIEAAVDALHHMPAGKLIITPHARP